MADLALKIKLTADNDIGRAIGAATRMEALAPWAQQGTR